MREAGFYANVVIGNTNQSAEQKKMFIKVEARLDFRRSLVLPVSDGKRGKICCQSLMVNRGKALKRGKTLEVVNLVRRKSSDV